MTKWYGNHWYEEIEHEDSIEVIMHPCEFCYKLGDCEEDCKCPDCECKKELI